MSTNKSTEESLGLVPAAMAWWKNISDNDPAKYTELAMDYAVIVDPKKPRKITEESVMDAWMQEVVLPWWASFDKGRPMNLTNNMPDSKIVELYLKEQEVKEKGIPVGKLVPESLFEKMAEITKPKDASVIEHFKKCYLDESHKNESATFLIQELLDALAKALSVHGAINIMHHDLKPFIDVYNVHKDKMELWAIHERIENLISNH